jgi:hypothetical protein
MRSQAGLMFPSAPSRIACKRRWACSPTGLLLTSALRKKRLAFARKYKNGNASYWRNVMYSDDSMFFLVYARSATVRCNKAMSRYRNNVVLETVGHSASVMVWGCFSGKRGREGL